MPAENSQYVTVSWDNLTKRQQEIRGERKGLKKKKASWEGRFGGAGEAYSQKKAY